MITTYILETPDYEAIQQEELEEEFGNNPAYKNKKEYFDEDDDGRYDMRNRL